MTYVTESMRAALAEHRLRQVCNVNGVRVFRMANPGNPLDIVDIVFLPERILVSGFRLVREDRTLRDAFNDPNGWLCAIQQRFAELYREREARIAAIVAGWEWTYGNFGWHLDAPEGTAAAVHLSSYRWRALLKTGEHVRLDAADVETAKLAARAAVLAQAKEHPELWHCGAVDE